MIRERLSSSPPIAGLAPAAARDARREAQGSVARGPWLEEEPRMAPGVYTRRLATSHWPLATTRRGFTLVELLITISIIGIMATMVLFAMFQAQETAKVHKTRALITKLDAIIMRRYDDFRTRRVPVQFTGAEMNNPKLMAKMRLDCLRDMMRMEMPDRWSDILDGPVTPLNRTPPDKIQRPASSVAYLARYNAIVGNTTWPVTATPPLTASQIIENQGAECLYMIVMECLAQEGDSRDVFKATDIGDVDGDGFPEFVDAWGSPIEFIRWAPGYLSDLQVPIRIQGRVQQIDAHTATITVTGNNGRRLNQTPGSYIGGAIVRMRVTNNHIDSQYLSRITGYQYDNSTTPPTVTFTCETPSSTLKQPFNGDTMSGEFAVMEPDPFDSRGVYPIYPNGAVSFPVGDPDTSIPTYAIYPLIISKGSDRAMGVKDGAGGGTTLRYVEQAMNPFYVAPPVNESYGLMLGSIPTANDSEPLWYKGCHNDNITNHSLSTR